MAYDPIEVCEKMAFCLHLCKHFPAKFMVSVTQFGPYWIKKKKESNLEISVILCFNIEDYLWYKTARSTANDLSIMIH